MTTTHPFAAFLPEALAADAARPRWTPGDAPLPALYLSHGAPPLFEDAGWMDELFAWAQRLPSRRRSSSSRLTGSPPR